MDEQTTLRERYKSAYADILALPEMRERRRAIQEAYGEARERDRLAGSAQRAAARGNLGAERIADDYADEADAADASHARLCTEYEIALEDALIAAGIPVGLFRSPAKRGSK